MTGHEFTHLRLLQEQLCLYQEGYAYAEGYDIDVHSHIFNVGLIILSLLSHRYIEFKDGRKPIRDSRLDKIYSKRLHNLAMGCVALLPNDRPSLARVLFETHEGFTRWQKENGSLEHKTMGELRKSAKMFVQGPTLSLGTFLGDVYKVKKRQAEEDDRAAPDAKRPRTSVIGTSATTSTKLPEGEIETAVPVGPKSKVEHKKSFPILDLSQRKYGRAPLVSIPSPKSPPQRPKLKIRLGFPLKGPTEPLQGTTAAPKAAYALTGGPVVVPEIPANALPITSTANLTPPLSNVGPRMPLVKASVTAKLPIGNSTLR